MHKLEINACLFNRLFPTESRREMEQRVACALLWGDPAWLPQANLTYFAHLGAYAERAKDLPENVDPLNDLSAPNIAVLDYVVKFLSPKHDRILDFACGLGNLVVRLHELGYAVAGFDRWTQLSYAMTERFLTNYGCHPPSIFTGIQPTTLVFIGGHWEWITPADKAALFTPALKRILVDCNYSPRAVEGFELTSYYQGLLHVFERCGE